DGGQRKISTQRGDKCPNAVDMGEACGLFNRSRRQYMPSDAGTIRRAEFIRPQSARRGRYQAVPALFGGAGSTGAARALAMAMTLRNRTGIDFAAGTLLRLAWCQTGSSTLHSG